MSQKTFLKPIIDFLIKRKFVGLVFSFALLLLAGLGLYLSALRATEATIIYSQAKLEVDFPLNGTYFRPFVVEENALTKPGSGLFIFQVKLDASNLGFNNLGDVAQFPIKLKLLTNAPVQAINIFNNKHQKLVNYSYSRQGF
jgi:hypothetical protein